jgi:hypothetical protein
MGGGRTRATVPRLDAWFFVPAEGTSAQFGMERYQLLRADGPAPDGGLDDLFAVLRR